MLRPSLALALLFGASIYGVACAGSPPFQSDYEKIKENQDGGTANGSSGPNGNPTPMGDDGGTGNSNDDEGGSGSTGSGDDGGGSNTGDDDGGSGGTVNGCTAADFAANDLSAPSATRSITFGASGQVIIGRTPQTIPPGPSQYKPNCITITESQSVSFVGPFTNFPLAPSGGTTPTPITNVTGGTSTSVMFFSAGTYGFENPNAPTVMFGAVLVTP